MKKFIPFLGMIAMSVAVLWPLHSIAKSNSDMRDYNIVFLISEDPDNYEAHLTIPPFAAQLDKMEGYSTTVLLGSGERNAFYFPNLEAIKKADLVVVFCRRLALQPKQMKIIQKYLQKGKPLVGIRTANHAFAVRDGVADGYVDWWDFVPEILGTENQGYGGVEHGTTVTVTEEGKSSPILKDVNIDGWHSIGNVYKNGLLPDSNAEVLLIGQGGPDERPIAWTRVNKYDGKVFYTSLGYPKDFDNNNFIQLLTNAIDWTQKK